MTGPGKGINFLGANFLGAVLKAQLIHADARPSRAVVI